MTTPQQHLAKAKEYAERGDAFYGKAADEIVAAREADPTLTQQQIADRVGRGQTWVSDLLAWRESGRVRGTPFAGSSQVRLPQVSKMLREADPARVAPLVTEALSRPEVREHLATDSDAADELHEASSDVYEREDRHAGHNRSRVVKPQGNEGLERSMGEMEIRVALHKLVQLAQRLGLEGYLIEQMEESRQRLEISIAAGDPKQAVAELERWLAAQGEEA